MYDIIIIGSGVTGAFIARKLARYEVDVLLLDKETDVGNVTSNANSAIIHSGYDPLPGTLKAKLNVLGNAMFDQIADELDVSFKRIGSLTIAFNDEQMLMLKKLYDRSVENGVETYILNKDELVKAEPNISKDAIGALYAPTAGIIDPFNLVIHAVENAIDNGVILKLSEKVISIKKEEQIFKVTTDKETYQSRIVINAAGLGGEEIARMVEDVDWQLVPRKGQYFVLEKLRENLVSHTIFPMPSEKGKGVLVSPTSSHNYIVGPSSEPVKDVNDYSTDLNTLMHVRSQSLELIPSIPFSKTIRVFSGIRPTSTRHDFILESAKGDDYFINVSGIESPGLVSAPAIADYVFDNLLSKLIVFKEKNSFNPRVKRYMKLENLTPQERVELIKNNKDFGDIICTCEGVSRGEILDLLNSNVPPHTVKAVKKRTRAGFGKCQGTECGHKVAEILAEYYGISPTELPEDKDN